MKKIKSSIPLLDLKGKELKNGEDIFTLGRAISGLLSSKSGKFGNMKSWILAKRFYTEEEVEIDEADFEILEGTVKDDQSYTPLVLGQILEYFQTLK
jgi:hypothetical protein